MEDVAQPLRSNPYNNSDPLMEARMHIVERVVAPPLTATNDPSRSPQSSEVTAQVHAVLQAQTIAHVDVVGTLSDGAHNGGGLNGQDAYTGRILPVAVWTGDGIVADPIGAHEANTYTHEGANFRLHNCVQQSVCATGDRTHALTTRSAAEEDGTGRGTPIVPVGIFQDSEFGVAQYDSAGTLRAGRIPEHQMVIQPLVPMTFDWMAGGGGSDQSFRGKSRSYITDPPDRTRALTACKTLAVATHMAVRRLTPRECERLQGFPDNWTLIPWKKKPADECPDGPRYKALGNSMAVPCMNWLGRKINAEYWKRHDVD
jgi:hypothetical protein